ncbi:MAG: DNA repair protein RecO [Oscillospiraceae bacterium]|nr:DNA repair protein RecO [Oscillospiraceae bacterium]MBQ5339989.1 DNA repair protein RecO [Oscillospiraceae bacterium]MBR5364267.1 DNA repair protein RecO [Oscillospiraceae bacterium]
MQTHLNLKGLVIRETAFQDADKIIDLLTEDGIRTVRARSARKPGSKYAAVTQLFSYGDFCLRCSGDRLFLDSAVSLNLFFGIRNDLDALALASYFSELIRNTVTNQPQPQILRLYLLALHHLSEHSRPLPQVKSVFELRLMTELGMMPNLVCCQECMTYLPKHPVLRVRFADFVCRECREIADNHDIPATEAVLLAARHVVFTEFDRLFQFRLKGKSADLFAQYTEQYVLHRLGMHFPTLDFYHAQCNPQSDD